MNRRSLGFLQSGIGDPRVEKREPLQKLEFPSAFRPEGTWLFVRSSAVSFLTALSCRNPLPVTLETPSAASSNSRSFAESLQSRCPCSGISPRLKRREVLTLFQPLQTTSVMLVPKQRDLLQIAESSAQFVHADIVIFVLRRLSTSRLLFPRKLLLRLASARSW